MSEYLVTAMYKFTTLENYTEMRNPLLEVMEKNDIRGTLLLAREGINGTVSGKKEGTDNLLAYLKSDPRLADLDYKISYHEHHPFYRTKVKLKREIVTMGVEGIDPRRVVGTYVKPEDWNDLITDPDTILIDTRNEYETSIGSFKNAVFPPIHSFREFPDFVNKNLIRGKHKKVAMFCTGGIRCEKSTAYLKSLGFDEVYHLKGGILKYLEDVPEEDSLWEGECFVFDNRVTVKHSLVKGDFDQCYACRMPITEEEKNSPQYVKGVSCPHCFDKTTSEQKRRFRERQNQMLLSSERGEDHIGAGVQTVIQKRRQIKLRKKMEQSDHN